MASAGRYLLAAAWLRNKGPSVRGGLTVLELLEFTLKFTRSGPPRRQLLAWCWLSGSIGNGLLLLLSWLLLGVVPGARRGAGYRTVGVVAVLSYILALGASGRHILPGTARLTTHSHTGKKQKPNAKNTNHSKSPQSPLYAVIHARGMPSARALLLYGLRSADRRLRHRFSTKASCLFCL